MPWLLRHAEQWSVGCSVRRTLSVVNLTPNEVLLVALVALLLLGPKRLPDAMRRVGRLFGVFKSWATDVRQELDAAVSPPVPEPVEPDGKVVSSVAEPVEKVVSSVDEPSEPEPNEPA